MSSAASPVRFLEGAELSGLREDWLALYELQRTQGMLLALPAGAFDLWVESMQPILGRFGVVVAAEVGGDIVAFGAGRIRTVPAHFGGQPVGYISEVFTRPDHRGRGLGAVVVEKLVAWFHGQEISRVELHVVAGNDAGLRFYLRHGWAPELTQLVLTSTT